MLYKLDYLYLDDAVMVDVGEMFGFFDNDDASLRFQSISLFFESLRLPCSSKESKLRESISGQLWEECLSDDLVLDSLLYGGEIALFQTNERSNRFHSIVIEKWSSLSHKIFSIFPIETSFQNRVVKIGELCLPKKDASIIGNRLVHTSTTIKNLCSVGEALLSFQPIVVQGISGGGKSSIIRELAALTGHDADLVTLHLNDQSDSKALIGSYICTDVPGEFMWQSGVITQAVINGFWIVIEDLDKVPIDFVALLTPLLESRQLYLPHHSSPIRAHHNFRLFGTRSIHNVIHQEDTTMIHNLRHFSHLWNYVSLEEISDAEAEDIVLSKHPSMSRELLTKLTKIFTEVSQFDVVTVNEDGENAKQLQLLKKQWTLRDFLKISSRIAFHSAALTNASGYITNASNVKAFQDVVDVVCAGTRNSRNFFSLAAHVGKKWGLGSSEVEHSVINANPNVDIDESSDGRNALITVGRAKFICNKETLSGLMNGQTFAQTSYARRLLEKIAVSVEMNEPILLVGETGSGKTTTIQELARVLGKKLIVQNLSLSSDVSDLLGGYRPVTIRQMLLPAYETFVRLFQDTLSAARNTDFLQIVAQLFKDEKWKKLIKAFDKACNSSIAKLEKVNKQSKLAEWQEFHQTIKRYETNLSKIESGFAFHFQKGLLVEALQNGYWILMDEINLASADTLQGLSGFLDPDDQVVLADCGCSDLKAIKRHPDFRIFAAMNPPTDVCKKELPASLRSRFTELYVDEMTDANDLMLIVNKYMSGIQDAPVTDIVQVYLGCRAAAEDHLVDGTGQRPRYSLRSLTRSLRAAQSFLKMGLRPLGRCLFEAFLLNFQTMLSDHCRSFMYEFLKRSFYPEGSHKDLNFPPHRPGGKTTSADDWTLVKPFWLKTGTLSSVDWSEKSDSGIVRFVGTSTVMSNIRTVAAGIAANVAPILLQGPTSIGKTTMVQFLAAKTGHRCVRINNHEHTDVQEYIGGYVTGADGQLVFQDGLLVEALRHGYWIILDELNLAPSDVLEALNRLLDDNRELLIPETGEIVKPVPGFQLFATQNPPGIYGGRKPLSLAFRNRFIEVDLTDLPSAEIEEIITKSCGIAPKFSGLLVKIMVEIQTHRQKSNLLLGKHGTVTTRDLIKWGYRHPNSALEVSKEGFMLIGEKLRSAEEHTLITSILNNVCKTNLNVAEIYENDDSLQRAQATFKSGKMQIEGVGGVAITSSFKRMWTLLSRALAHKEPVLLVGETGCGKTMVCQLFAAFNNRNLQIVNCHQSTETSDFIGGLRPVRGRDLIRQSLVNKVNILVEKVKSLSSVDMNVVTIASDDTDIRNNLDIINKELGSIHTDRSPQKALKREKGSTRSVTISDEVDHLVDLVNECNILWTRLKALFEWEDGPLVKSMKNGDIFLMDEINLADDAVIERLNSVLEFNREITLAEKGGLQAERLHAHDDFRIIATMNPSGDFGKRELSPALRSRFTEIWVPAISNLEEMVLIIKEVLALAPIPGETFSDVNSTIAGKMLEFMTWINGRVVNCMNGSLIMTIRETLAWASFIAYLKPLALQDVFAAYVHGAFLTILDGLGIGQSVTRETVHAVRLDAFQKLLELCPLETQAFVERSSKFLLSPRNNEGIIPEISNGRFQVGIFSIPLGPNVSTTIQDSHYTMSASSTVLNLGRILRGLQIKRPILLEGPPGVGKSSLVTNLAKFTGHKLIRINLSEHSELSDLLGSDLPAADDENKQNDSTSTTPKFKWCDGIFLKAMKEGSWVLLDELNLAPQTVLEGLNACFDHREQVFLPEIGKVVHCAPTFRVFCAQNPMLEGGGRKGLPASFLSRFSRVYMESMSDIDMVDVVKRVAKLDIDGVDASDSIVESMIKFIGRLSDDVTAKCLYGREGFPWEFNLRDVFRWCELFAYMCPTECDVVKRNMIMSDSAYMLFVLRMRSVEDRFEVMKAFNDCFGYDFAVETIPQPLTGQDLFQIGAASIPVHLSPSIRNSPYHGIFSSKFPIGAVGNQKNIEVLATCVALRWPCLLVGPAGSGKRRSIEYLAGATGRQLRYFSAIPSLDSTEILGSFEQSNIFHVLYRIVDKLEQTIMALLGHLVSKNGSPFQAPQFVEQVVKVVSSLQSYIKDASSFLKGEASSLTTNSPIINDLQNIVKSLWNVIHHEFIVEFCNSCGLIDDVNHAVENIGYLLGTKSQGAFAWENGVIVEALLKGHWLVFDNVNLASASVLDRLNSVLEPNGSLVLTEDGSGKVITPHENFRIFFVMDPSFGEVSRAMRNRCVEVYYNIFENSNESVSTNRKLIDSSNFSNATQSYMSLNRNPMKSAQDQLTFRRFSKRFIDRARSPWEILLNSVGNSWEGFQIAFKQEIITEFELAILQLQYQIDQQHWVASAVKDAYQRVLNSPGSWLYHKVIQYAKLRQLFEEASEVNEFSEEYLVIENILYLHRKNRVEELYVMLKNIPLSRQLRNIVQSYVEAAENQEAILLSSRADILSLECLYVHSNKTSTRISYENGEKISLLSLSYLVGLNLVPVDCKELFPLQWLYKILTAASEYLLRVSALSETTRDELHCLWQKRDIIVRVLSKIQISAETLRSLKWDDLLISVKWFRKSIESFAVSCQLQLEINITEAFHGFFKTVNEIWGIFVDVQKLRLWKEGGYPAIPTNSAGWSQLIQIRSIITQNEIFNVMGGKNGNFPSIFIRIPEAVSLLSEWVGLYSTFYWGCTNEHSLLHYEGSSNLNSASPKIGLSMFASLVPALNAKLQEFGRQNQTVTISEIQDKLGPMDFHEREGYLFSDPSIVRKISTDRLVRAILPAILVGEHVVISKLLDISDTLGKIYIDEDIDLRQLGGVIKDTIRFALQSTSYNPLFLRDLQTLLWCIDSVLSPNIDLETKTARKHVLKRLSRTLFNSIDSHLLSFYFHDQDAVRDCNISFVSETLKFILNRDSSMDSSDSLMYRNIENRTGNIMKSVCLLLSTKQIDPKLLFPKLQSIGLCAPRGSNDYAEVTINSHRDAQISIALLFLNGLVEKQSSKSEVVLILSKLSVYLFDILFAVRDFFPQNCVVLFKELQRKFLEDHDFSAVATHILTQNVFSMIENESMKSLFNTILNPVMEILSKRKDPSYFASSNGIMDAGICWSLVGLVRFHLLVPSIPIDPAMKPARKAALLKSDAENRSLVIRTEIKLNSLAGQSPMTESTVEEILFLENIEKKIEYYNLRSVERLETEHSFENLYLELKAVSMGSLDPLAVANLIMESKSSPLDRKNVVDRINTLCSTIKSVSEVLKTRYFQFEDVVVPILSSLENVTRGLMLLEYQTSVASATGVRTVLDCLDTVWKSTHDNRNYRLDNLSTDSFFEGSMGKTADIASVTKKDGLRSLCYCVAQSLEITLLDYCRCNSLIDSKEILKKMEHVLRKFTDVYLTDLQRRAKKEAEKNALYKYKDDVDHEKLEEEKRLRASFPDHLQDFGEYLEAADQSMDMGESQHQESNDLEINGYADDEFISLVIGIHARSVLLRGERTNLSSLLHDQKRSACDVVDRSKLLDEHLSRVRMLMLKICDRSIGEVKIPRFSSVGTGLSLVLLSSMKTQLKCSDLHSWFSSNVPDTSVDRDLLLLLEGNNFRMTPESSYNPQNFHFDSNLQEVLMAEVPLNQLLHRCTELLNMFPGNEILLKICKLVIQISQYHVTVPIGKMLVALQVLLKCAQEWENYAARHVSIDNQMAAISNLISRWRTLELKSWENLLRGEEILYAKKASKMWFSLFQIFTKSFSEVLTSKKIAKSNQTPKGSSDLWERLFRKSPTWIFNGSMEKSSLDGDRQLGSEVTDVKDWTANSLDQCSSLDEYFRKLVETLDMFLRSSSVGEFPTRLHLIRLMASSLTKDSNSVTLEGDEEFIRAKFERISLGVWQYYQQFLPGVRKFQDLLRIPLQQKVKNEVKLGKWDTLNVYALMENADKIHRKLTKFVKEYSSEVLEFPLHSLLQRELMKGLVNDAGESVAAYEVPDVSILFPQLAHDKADKQDSLSDISEKYLDMYDFSNEGDISAGKTKSASFLPKPFIESHQRLARLDSYTEKIALYFSQWLDFSQFLEEDNNDGEDERSTEETSDNEKAKEKDDKNLSLCFSLSAADIAERLCEEIFARISSLRGEGSTKPLKLKAVRDLMDILRSHGFSYLRSEIPALMRESVESLGIVATLPSMLATDLTFGSNSSRDLFEKAEYYFVRNLAELPQLRTQMLAPHSKDISQKDAFYMVTFAESMVLSAMRARTVLDTVVEDFSGFAQIYSRFDHIIFSLKDHGQQVSGSLGFDPNRDAVKLEIIHKNVAQILHFILEIELISKTATETINEAGKIDSFGMLQDSLQIQLAKLVSAGLQDFREVISILSSILSTDEKEQVVDLSKYQSQEANLIREMHSFQKLHCLFEFSPIRGTEYLIELGTVLNKVKSIIDHNKEIIVLLKDEESYCHWTATLSESIELCHQQNMHGSSLVGNGPVGDEHLFVASSKIVDQTLICIQRLKGLYEELCMNTNPEMEKPLLGCFGEILFDQVKNSNSLNTQLSCAMLVFGSFKMDKITSSIQEFVQLFDEHPSIPACNISIHITSMEKIEYLLSLMRKAFQSLLDQFCVAYKAHSKLTYIIIRIFRNLFAKGICSNETSDENDDGKGSDMNNMKFEDDVEGTGMGEGEGKKDVSDEIQNEEQLLGNKKEKLQDLDNGPKEKQPEKKLDKEEKDKGVEMSEDFDGDMYDIPSEEENQEENSEEEEEEDGDEPDREMGEADMDDIVDEKQWDSEDEEGNDENENQGKEKFEDNSKAKGETLDGEMHTRDDDEEKEGDKEESKGVRQYIFSFFLFIKF